MAKFMTLVKENYLDVVDLVQTNKNTTSNK